MRCPIRRTATGAVFLVLAVTGCFKPETGNIKGEVTLDGQPLKEGLIRFIPTDGVGQNADAIITDGRFTTTVPPGAKRVEITAPKVVGKRKMYDTADSPMVDDIKELIPANYNVKSELTMTVEKGNQEKKFELKSNP